MNQKKIFLDESKMPKQWYNIQADMPTKLLPPLHPKTMMPVTPEDLAALFPKEIIKQEMSQERWIDIPEEVREKYLIWRPTPLIRASNLEKFLGVTNIKIYYKYEGTSPAGSHKPNTSIPQVYYSKQEGVKKIVTETGAGQWGTALAIACSMFQIESEVFMVKISYNQKPYRKIMMNVFGGTVHPSPSPLTNTGRTILAEDPNCSGSLGIAISEAIEIAVQSSDTKYALGSVLNHVLMHQTIIGLECEKQFESVGDYPDVIVAPLGGGSNFAGVSFPFLRHQLQSGKKVRCVAVEPSSCPKLTKGEFRYDFADNAGFTPLLPMYTLGHNFMPANTHAGGLRYHGASALCSQLLKDKLIEAVSIDQLECFKAGVIFAKTEGIIPAPEASHAIAQVFREVEQAKKEGKPKTILFNLCGHGLLDLQGYQEYFDGKLQDSNFKEADFHESMKALDSFPKI